MCQKSCFECEFIVDDSDYGEYGAVYSRSYLCRKHENMEENENFPYENAPEECFQLAFWHSEFSDLVDGSEESLEKAYHFYNESLSA